ncbi:hypothetical protein [Hymenobacter edaphi]|uniref:DUF304 domain-containing protein n=1 Tax=Hymenobacter edaphi TaxID=2211146 RepID=A0A328BMF7_9BACT|nr:hypothetical protein [Hymenobacter edaphi]RAK68157.1 hypothetical protein DLM85_08965 [Hymenobacter edaphi]
MLQIESNTSVSKGGCYVVASIFGLLALSMLRQHDFHQQPAQGWQYLLLIVLCGVVPPLAYASTLKRYRLTIDDDELLLEQVAGPVLVLQPMRTLLRWRVFRTQGRYSVGETLYLRFRQGDAVHINSMEYARFEEIVALLRARYAGKQQEE